MPGYPRQRPARDESRRSCFDYRDGAAARQRAPSRQDARHDDAGRTGRSGAHRAGIQGIARESRLPPQSPGAHPVAGEPGGGFHRVIQRNVIGMKFHTEYLTFKTAKHREYINITPEVEKALGKSGIQEGMILVSAMHITAGVWVNDAEDGLIADIDEWLEQLAPFRRDYRHHRTGETNGDSHLKSLLVHHEVIVPVTKGKLDFGPWQQVYYAEFDGQRAKRLIIKVMGE